MNLFSTREPEYHRIEKRKVGNAYALPRLLESEQAIDSCIELFMTKLHTLTSNGQSVDIGTWLQYFAFDVVGVWFSIQWSFTILNFPGNYLRIQAWLS